MLAAVAALRFAWLTVKEGRAAEAEAALNRELDRLYRLLDLAGAVAEAARTEQYEPFGVAQLRFETARSPYPQLTACKELAAASQEDAFEIFLDARDELADEIGALERTSGR